MTFSEAYSKAVSFIDKCYLEDFNKGIVTMKRLPVRQITQRYSTYVDIIRKCQEIYNVMVFRNDSCIEEGLYVVGKEANVVAYIHFITSIITSVENDTEEYGTVYLGGDWKVKVYDYASKRARKFLFTVFEISDYMTKNMDLKQIMIQMSDQIIIKEYADSLSALNNKKRYHEKVRYID